MLSKYPIILLLCFVGFGLFGCEDDMVLPDCAAGKVFGNTCDGALLIQLYGKEKVGVEMTYMGENGTETYDNVVSTFGSINAVNPMSGVDLKSKVIHFRYRLATPEEQIHGICNTMVLFYSAPQVVLSDVGLTGCGREGEYK